VAFFFIRSFKISLVETKKNIKKEKGRRKRKHKIIEEIY